MEQANRLLSVTGLGASRPSELMENMLALLGSGETSFLLTHLFLCQLPPPVCTVLANSPLIRTKDYRAEEADRLLVASRQFSVHALLPCVHDNDDSVEEAAVTERQKREISLCFRALN